MLWADGYRSLDWKGHTEEEEIEMIHSLPAPRGAAFKGASRCGYNIVGSFSYHKGVIGNWGLKFLSNGGQSISIAL